MAADRTLALKLVTDTGSMSKDMAKVAKQQSRMASGFKRMGSVAKRAGGIALNAWSVVGPAVTDFIGDAIQGWVDGEKAAKDLDRTLTSTGKNTKRNMELIAQATQEALSVNVDDTEFVRSLTGLVDRAPGQSIARDLRILRLAEDLTAKNGKPLEANVRTISKALDGNGRALKELGINHIPKHIDKLKLLRRWERRWGQAAEDNANTIPGRFEQIQIQAGEFAEGIVGSFVEIADGLNAQFTAGTGGVTIAGSLDVGVSLVEGSLDLMQRKVTEGGVSLVAQFALLGQNILSGFTGRTSKLNDSIGGSLDDVQTTLHDHVEPVRTAAEEVAIAASQPIIERMQRVEDHAQDMADSVVASYQSMKARLLATKIPVIGPTFAVGFGVPELAEGGIVDRPTLAMIGERGPEAVVPLTGNAAAGWGHITVNITTGVGDPVAIGREVDRVLRAYRGRAGLPV